MTIATTAATSLKIALPTATLSHRAAKTVESQQHNKEQQEQHREATPATVQATRTTTP